MSALRLLQVCNVGRIVGGTAACAWTVTRALPEFEHVVAFLSDITPDTRAAFAYARIEHWPHCTRRMINAVRPDVVLLHNIGGREPLSGSSVTVQYVHSAGRRAPADLTVYCSRWLAGQMHRSSADVLYQGVPRPLPDSALNSRNCDGRLVVGRICTPIAKKWPVSLLSFYARMASQFPAVEWEFVGCPVSLQDALLTACRSRARFFPAGWEARSRLWGWDALLYHNPEVTESFGRMAAESLRAGCIPVVDALGGFVEQVTPASGFLCQNEDDFAEALSALRDSAVRRRMSAAARTDGDRYFSIASFRERLCNRLAAVASCPVSHL